MLAKLTAPLEKMAPHDFKRKFHAWWEGEVYTPLPESGDASSETISAEESVAQEASTPAHIDADVLMMAVAQGIWGQGYLQPGSAKYYADITHSLSLAEEVELALLGAGIGGIARDIVSQSGCPIAAYENISAACAEAERQVAQAAFAEKLTLHAYDPETIELPEQAYDALASFERFSLIKEKQRLLKQVELSLRAGGYLLITDYVTTGAELEEESLSQMFPPAMGDAHLVSVEDYVTLISEAGFGLRVQEDITQDYLALIQGGATRWTKLMSGLENAESAMQAKIFQAVGDEHAFWTKRLEALQSGQLAVYRFLALKPGSAS